MDGIPEVIKGPGGDLAEQRLQLGEGVLDRIEIGRIGLQVTQGSACGFNCDSHAGPLVDWQIAPDDDGSGYPSIAAWSLNLGMDVMCQSKLMRCIIQRSGTTCYPTTPRRADDPASALRAMLSANSGVSRRL